MKYESEAMQQGCHTTRVRFVEDLQAWGKSPRENGKEKKNIFA